MKLPNELIVACLCDFCIFYYKDLKFEPDVPPHYYINVPLKDNSSVLLCIFTSQIEKRMEYYSRNTRLASSTNNLVEVKKNTFSFITKDCVIDCNNPELLTKEEFLRRIDNTVGIDIKERNTPKNLQSLIIDAIKNSPYVKPYIKKLLK